MTRTAGRGVALVLFDDTCRRDISPFGVTSSVETERMFRRNLRDGRMEKMRGRINVRMNYFVMQRCSSTRFNVWTCTLHFILDCTVLYYYTLYFIFYIVHSIFCMDI